MFGEGYVPTKIKDVKTGDYVWVCNRAMLVLLNNPAERGGDFRWFIATDTHSIGGIQLEVDGNSKIPTKEATEDVA